MADAEVIRSFLVSVGVDADEKGIKKFDQSVTHVSKTVAEFGKALAAAAVAASAAVVKVSSQFEDLYYASQRLRSSVDNIKAFDFGVSQMGGSAKEARGSLEAFASFMRSNPLGEGWVRGLGVETRNATGEAREYADVLRDVGTALQKMPYWAAKIRADQLGIDESTLQALLRGTDIWSDRYRKMVQESGVDMDQMSKDLTDLMQKFRLWRAQLEIYVYKAVSKLDPKVRNLAAALAAVGVALGAIALVAGPVAAAVVGVAAAIAALIADFNAWRNGADSFIDWEKWSDQIDKAVGAFGDLGEAISVLGVTLGPVATNFGAWLDEFASNSLEEIADLTDGLTLSILALNAALNKDWKSAWRYLNTTPDQLQAQREAANPGAQSSRERRDGARRNPPPPPSNDNMTPAQKGSAAEAMSYFMKNGWTKEQAAGIVANIKKESEFNPRAVGDGGKAKGIAQWHPDRQAEFRKFAGKDIGESTFAEQLAFIQHELTRGNERAAGNRLRGARSAYDAGAVVSKLYERPKNEAGEAMERGRGAMALMNNQRLGNDSSSGRTVTINAKTEVKVEGGADARETGRVVSAAVDRRNSDLVRNTKSAIA